MKEETQIIHKKFIKADYPTPFVNNIISQYNTKTKEQQIGNDDDYIIYHSICLKTNNHLFY